MRILTTTTNDEGSEVYLFVATLQMHLQYEANAAIEKSTREDLKRLYNEGNAIIKEREKRKQGDNSGDEQNSNNDDKEDGNKDVQNLNSNDDNDNEEQKSESGEEEKENASKKEEEEDLNVFTV